MVNSNQKESQKDLIQYLSQYFVKIENILKTIENNIKSNERQMDCFEDIEWFDSIE